jgi:glucosamine--fructose-6-phosphate aminotransferase (isomerizing)
MCGIVGAYLRRGSAVGALVEGLRVLEYRGYDSAGIGAVGPGGVVVRRRMGRLERLEELLTDGSMNGLSVAVGHTRWATHGEPSDENAHPHTDDSGRIALVHNGIIENYAELRRELVEQGVRFRSQTDTEVLSHLIGRAIAAGADPMDAVRASLARVRGYYAVALVTAGPHPRLIGARSGPPLIAATTPDAGWLASDVLALLPHTRDMVILEDGDVVEVAPGKLEVTRVDGTRVDRPVRRIDWDAEAASKGGYAHFMLKEIHEQPDVLARTAFDRLLWEQGDVLLEGDLWSDRELRAIERVAISACGTALHAGWIARFLIEELARVPCDVDYASEFRYRNPVVVPRTLMLAISQSGETADTLAALRLARQLGARTASICNVVGSSVARESEATILTHAGPEIGVASTKAFVAQVLAAYLFAIRLGRARGVLPLERGRALLHELRTLRPRMEALLSESSVRTVERVAAANAGAKGFFFLGRHINYPVALEGALKLKEISYMHAEGYPAGEMKHGPIALIEPAFSVVVVNSRGRVADKVQSNLEQVRARGGKVICVGSHAESLALADERVPVPATEELLSPVLNVIPLQLLSYHVARLRGCDIDKPRNLAKSVTVE